MENITIGQMVTSIGTISIISAFFLAIYKWYKKSIYDKLINFNNRISKLEKDSKTNKEENTILLKGLLACLKGLKEQGCDGAVITSISEIENYLLEKAHV